jgi:hypothetical protein
MLFKRKRKAERPMPGFLMAWLVRERAWRVKLSGWLSAKTAQLSRRQLLAAYTLFVIAGSLAYTWVIVRAVRFPEKTAMPSSMTMPKSVHDSRNRMVIVPNDGADFRRVFDSLRRDPVTGPALDSLLRARPGLADSLAQLLQVNK